MGVLLERSEIAKELLEALQLILRRVPWRYGYVCNSDGHHICGNYWHHWGCRGRDDADRFAPYVKSRVQADTGIGHNRLPHLPWVY